MWRNGDVIAARNIWHGRVRTATPAFVVEDGTDRLVLWVPTRSPFKGPQPRGVPTEWELVDGTWTDSGLVVHHRGEPWIATHVRPADRVPWWYVDVADSIRFGPVSFDHRDLLLDVVTEDEPRIVDRDELAEAVELGVLSQVEARDAERAAAHVLTLFERAAAPFDGEWEGWEPPDSWGIPSLPEGWDKL